MDVIPIQPTARTTTTSTPPEKSALSSDFETFLKMLTAQMENQDPLNPLESSDFAVQLATFSGVEQQVRTNDLLESVAAVLGGAGIGQFADWVGREARTTAPAYFDGAPITVTTETVVGTEAADLVVRDQSGRVVDRKAMDPAGGEVVWSGRSEAGQPFLTGLYSFTTESRASEDVIAEIEGMVYSIVREARLLKDGTVKLAFDGGATVSPEAVTAIRLPES